MEMRDIFKGRSGNIVGTSVGSRPVTDALDKVKGIFSNVSEITKEATGNIFIRKR